MHDKKKKYMDKIYSVQIVKPVIFGSEIFCAFLMGFENFNGNLDGL